MGNIQCIFSAIGAQFGGDFSLSGQHIEVYKMDKSPGAEYSRGGIFRCRSNFHLSFEAEDNPNSTCTMIFFINTTTNYTTTFSHHR